MTTTDTTITMPAPPWTTPVGRDARIESVALAFDALAKLCADPALSRRADLRAALANAPDYVAGAVDAIEAAADTAIADMRRIVDALLGAHLAAQEARHREALAEIDAQRAEVEARANERPDGRRSDREASRAERAATRQQREELLVAADRAVAAYKAAST